MDIGVDDAVIELGQTAVRGADRAVMLERRPVIAGDERRQVEEMMCFVSRAAGRERVVGQLPRPGDLSSFPGSPGCAELTLPSLRERCR